MKRLVTFLTFLLLLLSGCTPAGSADPKATREFFSMDTVMEVRVYDGSDPESAAKAAQDEIYRLDRLFSVSNPNGEIAIANANGTVQLSEDGVFLISQALQLARETEGLFDITLQPLIDCWGFYSDSLHIPDDTELDSLLANAGSDHVSLDGSVLTLEPGVGLDLGAIAKGYASDRAAEAVRSGGTTSAMLILGGNVYAVGTKNGSPWTVAIQDPKTSGGYVGMIEVSDTAVVTSGTYQRFLEQDGQRYHHILDPRTGRPAQSGLVSVTIVCESGMIADALSTARLVMGLEDAVNFWRQSQYNFEAILVTEDDRVYITNGLESVFRSNLPYEVMSR